MIAAASEKYNTALEGVQAAGEEVTKTIKDTGTENSNILNELGDGAKDLIVNEKLAGVAIGETASDVANIN
jgi:hypothetical protein